MLPVLTTMPLYILYGYITTLVFLTGPSAADICSSPVCKFDLTVRYASTMVYRTPRGTGYSVALNGTRLQVVANTKRQLPDKVIGTFVNEDDVITADGFRRNVMTINDQFPGPAIEVYEGAQVRVYICL